MAGKKAKAIRKTETGIRPAHLWKRSTLSFEAARKPKNFFSAKQPKAKGCRQPNPNEFAKLASNEYCKLYYGTENKTQMIGDDHV